jgi:NAD(P)-dependent dehydrogenase (short-subunit alcohol dehydrogenase family)
MGVLDDKVAIVTGTSRGVGVGIAHELLRAGATVVGCSRSPLDTIFGVDAESDGRNAPTKWSAIKAITTRSTPW